MFEKNLKKFIGFSSVNQLGFIFVFGVTSKIDNFYAILTYLLVYFITSVLFFILLMTTVVVKNFPSNIQNRDFFFYSRFGNDYTETTLFTPEQGKN
jgi:NADH:ubiquinone oxidoreductase subunit 2 (subunit N)